jgi:hypothetical protein
MSEVTLESETFNRSFTVRSADPRFASALLDARMMAWLLDRSGEWGVVGSLFPPPTPR